MPVMEIRGEVDLENGHKLVPTWEGLALLEQEVGGSLWDLYQRLCAQKAPPSEIIAVLRAGLMRELGPDPAAGRAGTEWVAPPVHEVGAMAMTMGILDASTKCVEFTSGVLTAGRSDEELEDLDEGEAEAAMETLATLSAAYLGSQRPILSDGSPASSGEPAPMNSSPRSKPKPRKRSKPSAKSGANGAISKKA